MPDNNRIDMDVAIAMGYEVSGEGSGHPQCRLPGGVWMPIPLYSSGAYLAIQLLLEMKGTLTYGGDSFKGDTWKCQAGDGILTQYQGTVSAQEAVCMSYIAWKQERVCHHKRAAIRGKIITKYTWDSLDGHQGGTHTTKGMPAPESVKCFDCDEVVEVSDHDMPDWAIKHLNTWGLG